ncbi:hypothetical protein BFJ63_vAg14361 [Fusarium oxysporum f. sp. narcissi]|uniref:Uncharacterized protein n=2 Tax=Fusarium oxysporum TaxID=5507 RepID=A0A4Q2VC20_FUSOX|nr:hypothetical protein BFJ65_g18107 [Fusarium oxysporum f. sp. cepae]RKK39706.1 hypothetical protein BFJ67_g11349 [Fusarium oxysporum f. sp. cepae]RKK42018.1 hypothetical protein BFJ66_g10709 [Fusarium oxysporum f. sp. cepae]RKL13174.1 hypothetical protein BFJ70_g16002 [Fusarium oxysporum]RYC82739.1 hypothetical protein BFJ63_vAg14361 [Fusarium oxysporum f. sp. narcissi]
MDFDSLNLVQPENDLTKETAELASLVKPICTQLFSQLNYPGVPHVKDEAAASLLDYMHRRAVQIGVTT